LPKLSVDQLDLAGKRVFLRVDLNVPLEDGRVAEDTRIRAVVPTIEHCLKAGASVILTSHLGRPKGTVDPRYSLKPVAARLEDLLGRPVSLLPDCVGPEVEAAAAALKPGQTVLLENLRFHPGEEANDPDFARRLAALGDVYVNDAFAAAHRAHASTEGITHFLQPAAAGLLMARELEALGRIFERPERPVAAVLGGAKVSDKLSLVEHLLARVDTLLIGGGMAFTFLAALGYGVGRSLLEADRLEAARAILGRARSLGVRVRLPVDVVVARAPDSPEDIRTVGVREVPDELMGLDVGPLTVAQFGAALQRTKTVVWNGPLGVFEKPAFAAGTLGVARAVAGCGAFSVIGGGDTIAAVRQAGVTDRIGYISTAGGAFLEFLEGRTLPGVAALSEAP
jgi:phosphoglycerate kinase